MKVRVLKAFRDGEAGPVRRRGEVIEVSAALGKYLVAQGYAEALADADKAKPTQAPKPKDEKPAPADGEGETPSEGGGEE